MNGELVTGPGIADKTSVVCTGSPCASTNTITLSLPIVGDIQDGVTLQLDPQATRLTFVATNNDWAAVGMEVRGPAGTFSPGTFVTAVHQPSSSARLFVDLSKVGLRI